MSKTDTAEYKHKKWRAYSPPPRVSAAQNSGDFSGVDTKFHIQQPVTQNNKQIGKIGKNGLKPYYIN